MTSLIRFSESAPTRLPADSKAIAVTVQHAAVISAATSPRYCCINMCFSRLFLLWFYDQFCAASGTNIDLTARTGKAITAAAEQIVSLY